MREGVPVVEPPVEYPPVEEPPLEEPPVEEPPVEARSQVDLPSQKPSQEAPASVTDIVDDLIFRDPHDEAQIEDATVVEDR